MTTLQRWMRRIPAIALSIAFFVASSSADVVSPPFPLADKLYHATAYAVYGWVVALAVGTFPIAPRRRAIVALAVALVFAASDEVHQSFVPGRTADFFDWCADAVGAAVGLTVSTRHNANT